MKTDISTASADDAVESLAGYLERRAGITNIR